MADRGASGVPESPGRRADSGAGSRALVLMRAKDPLYEVAMTFGGHAKEDRFWAATLTALGERLGVPDPTVETRTTCGSPGWPGPHGPSRQGHSLRHSEVSCGGTLTR